MLAAVSGELGMRAGGAATAAAATAAGPRSCGRGRRAFGRFRIVLELILELVLVQEPYPLRCRCGSWRSGGGRSCGRTFSFFATRRSFGALALRARRTVLARSRCFHPLEADEDL